MKKKQLQAIGLFVLSVLFITACSSDPYENWLNDSPIFPGQGDGSSGSDTVTGVGTLLDFDIAIDESDMSGDDGTETIPTDSNDDLYDDFVENSTFSKTVTIHYDGDNVTIDNSISGVTIEQNGAHLSVTQTVKEVEYVLSGTSANGSFKMNSSNKWKLTLNGANLTNPTGAAINIQSKKRTFIVLADGTENVLCDGANYNHTDGEDMKACFFSEAQLIFSGAGKLSITGNYRHALCSDDYIRIRKGVRLSILSAVKDGIHTNDGIYINGGIINVNALDDGLQCEDGPIEVTGGKTTVITTGNGSYADNDISSSSAINGGSTFTMNGGTVQLKSTGSAGKGLNCDDEIIINNGTMLVITTGKQYVYGSLDSSAKGIKSKANLTINGGLVWVRTPGGEGSEGIESKNTLTINGGDVAVYAYDDCINASKHIEITGGTVYCYSTGNDGIDSNGTLTISGGTVLAAGTSAPEGGLDCDQNTMKITGGTVIGIGGNNSTPTASACTQPCIVYGATATAGQLMSVVDSNGTSVLTYQMPRTYSSMQMIISSPQLANGSYSIYTGGNVSNGETFYNLYTAGTYGGGSQTQSFTISSMVTSVGNTSSGGGGGMGPR